MRLAPLLLLMLCCPALADQLAGRVIGVADGDTLTILATNHRQFKIRLTEIDAPEKKQPFGTQSRKSLSELCFQRDAVVDTVGVDRFGRTLGRVRCNSVDANAEQIRRGMAWVFDRYVTDMSLYKIQEEAQSRRKGLWADVQPIPPWEWRAQARNNSRR